MSILFNDFARYHPANNAELRMLAHTLGYSSDANDYPSAPREKRLIIYELPPAVIPKEPVLTDILLFRPDRFLPLKVYRRIFMICETIIQSGLKFSTGTRGDNRSSTPAAHFGIWETYGTNPRVTKDTKIQNPVVHGALMELCRLLQDYVAPKCHNLLGRLAPQLLDIIRRYVFYHRLPLP
jgi:hypothetical protein